MEFTSALASRTGNENCTFKSCDVPSSFVNALHTSVGRHYLDSVTCGCKSGYSPNELRYGTEERSGCMSDCIHDATHLLCLPINSILEEVPISKAVKFPDDVVFVDGNWNKNSAVFQQKDLSDIVSVSVADDVVPNDEVLNVDETETLEGEVVVDFPAMDADKENETSLRKVVIEEVLVPVVGAPKTGGVFDRFLQSSGMTRLVSTLLRSLRPFLCPLWLTIDKAALSETRVMWHVDDANAAQEERRSYLRRANRGGVVDSVVVAGSGELPGSSSVGDGHAWLPCAPVRAIHDDRVVSSDVGLLAQRTRRRCVAYVETLVRRARTSMLSGVLGHTFLDLCRVSDSEMAAVVVEHSVVIRDSCFDDLQPMSTWRAMRRLLRICNAYDEVVGTWVLIPCIAGTTFRRTDEKLGAETGDFVMSYKSVVAAVETSRDDVGFGDIMVLCSAGMYALSNVLQEKLLKQNCTVKEALGILGVSGTLISVLQAWSWEWTRFEEVTWTSLLAPSWLGLLMCFFGKYELVNLFFSVAAPRENSGTDDERLMDKFNLDLPLVARLGGLSDHRSQKGKECFRCTTITYAVIQMVERIAEKSDKAKIITDGARTGCILSERKC